MNKDGTHSVSLRQKNSSGHGQLKLTRLQKDGIATKLARNPVVRLMGIELVEVSVGHATLMLPCREELHNSIGLVQGGILGVLGDVAGTVSLNSVMPDPLKVALPTIEFKLNFLRSASKKDIVARGKVVSRGRQIALCQVDISTEQGTLLATGLFTYMIKTLKSS